MADLNIVNCSAILGNRIYTQIGISVENGRIIKIGKECSLPKASRKLDLGGKLVLPGLIDVHVHLRDMELSYKEDFYSGTCAALAGGFTTVFDMPNTKPPTNSPSRLMEKMEKARGAIVSNIGFYAYPPADVKELIQMVKLGVIGFKIYLTEEPFTDYNTVRQLVYNVSRVGRIPVVFHAEDKEVIDRNLRLIGEELSASSSGRVYSIEAELTAIRRILEILSQSVRAHFAHITSVSSVKLVKGRNSAFSVEATPHHIFLSSRELTRLNNLAFTRPPLRGEKTRRALFEMVKSGHIDIIASDHAPHSPEEKFSAKLMPGVPGLETTLPLLLDAVNRGELTLERVVKLLAYNPAKIFGLRNRGSIREGNIADLTVVDLKKEHRIRASDFYSKAKYSPFDNWKLRGKQTHVILSGKIAMENGEILNKKGQGQLLLSKFL